MTIRPALFIILTLLALPAFAQDKTVKVEWTGKDLAGNVAAVPVADKISVLLFVREGQAQSTRAVEHLKTLPARDKLNILIVVSGENAEADAKKLSATGPGAPLVTDAKYELSGKLAVRVWPTTVLVKADGTLAGHVGGLPASFARDLDAYLDFAANRIDAPTLARRLAAEDLVADTNDQKAGRHLQVALRLIEKGMQAEAAGELDKARALQPKDLKLQAAMIRVLLDLDKGQDAAALLAALPANAIGPAEMNLLQGRVALAQGQWDAAGKFLQAATQLNPDPAEAYYHLGRYHEHQKDPAKAAAAYRKAYELTTHRVAP